MAITAILFKPSDLACYKAAFPKDYSNFNFVTFGVESLEVALEAKLKNISLIESYASRSVLAIHNQSDRISRAYDAEMALVRSSDLEIFNSIGWDYLNLYYLAYTSLRLSEIFHNILEKSISWGDEILIPWIDNPQDYYFDSVIQRQLIADFLLSKNKKIRAFKIPYTRPYKANAYLYGLDCMSETIPEVICHFPTSFYDVNYHRDRLIKQYGDRLMDVESPYFDVKISSNRSSINEDNLLISSDFISESTSFKLSRINHDMLNSIGIINPNLIKLQNQRLVSRFIFQIDSYNKFSKLFEKIKKLEVSCHDAGLSGPLISLAEKNNVETLVWPHSSFINNPIKSYSNLTFSHCTREPDSFLTLSSKLPNCNIVLKSFHGKIFRKPSSVIILLNELDDTAGLPLVNFRIYRECLSELISFFKAKDVNIYLRHKPSHSYNQLLSDFQQYAAPGNLSNYIKLVDCCVSIGTPTTAMSKFYLSDIDCLHIQFEDLTDIERFTFPEVCTLVLRKPESLAQELNNLFN